MEELSQFVCVCDASTQDKKTHAVDTLQQALESRSGGVFPPWKRWLQIPPTMSSSHRVQPNNSSIPQSVFFPQPFRGGQLYLEPPNNDCNSFFYDCLTTDGPAGIRVCLKWKFLKWKLILKEKWMFLAAFLYYKREERFLCKQWFGDLQESENWQFYRHLTTISTAFKLLCFQE